MPCILVQFSSMAFNFLPLIKDIKMKKTNATNPKSSTLKSLNYSIFTTNKVRIKYLKKLKIA